MHAHETHAHQMYAREMHAREIFAHRSVAFLGGGLAVRVLQGGVPEPIRRGVMEMGSQSWRRGILLNPSSIPFVDEGRTAKLD
jgi:hypothetical protein